MEKIRKIAVDYVKFIKQSWIFASVCNISSINHHPYNVSLHKDQISTEESYSQYGADHYRRLYSSFSLFVLLYIPEPGFEDAPVGEELMEWLNIHFIEPSTEEGDQLSSQDRPWEDENFWPYLTR
jgi:nuclear pore complex protein Nup85